MAARLDAAGNRRSSVRTCTWMLVVVLLGGAVRPLQAEPREGPRLVIVVDANTSRLAARIREELATMGFDPVVEAREVSRVDEMPAIARGGQAAAVARLEVFERGVRVWVFDRATGKTLTRELSPPIQSGEASLALHVVELLRASLLELELPDAPRGDLPPTPQLLEASGVPAAEPSPPVPVNPAVPPVEATAPPATAPPATAPPAAPQASDPVPVIGVELGAALIKGSGDLEQYPAMLMAVQVFLSAEFRLGPVGWIPVSDANHVAASGSSENRITLFGVEALWQPSRGVWRPFVSLGFAAAYLETRGDANTAEFEGETNRAITPGALLRGGLGVRLSRHWRLSPQATLGVQPRYFSIDYAEGTSARWGPWWGAVSLTAQGDFEE